jgi:23S rRNA (cytidine1920-2'-O)/16S rRNA (cytidine1409-2'-O)-methyltransferase
VSVNGKVIHKSSCPVSEIDTIEMIRAEKEYVSECGDKLQKAIREFNIDFIGKTVLDAGASTNGFTNCAIQHVKKGCRCRC